MEFPSLAEALSAQWGSLKDRWGPPPKPFVAAQGVYTYVWIISCFAFRSTCRSGWSRGLLVVDDCTGLLLATTENMRGLLSIIRHQARRTESDPVCLRWCQCATNVKC